MLHEKLPLTVIGVPLQVRLERPDRASYKVPVAVTGDVETVLPSAGALRASTGGVSSMLRVTLVVAVFPDESVTVPLTT
jgi:hypothetical protein